MQNRRKESEEGDERRKEGIKGKTERKKKERRTNKGWKEGRVNIKTAGRNKERKE